MSWLSPGGSVYPTQDASFNSTNRISTVAKNLANEQLITVAGSGM